MTKWRAFLDSVDYSHPMTTAKRHIAMLCEIVEGRSWSILELGSHAGISAAAMAMSAPESAVTAVDLCDTVPEAARVSFWAALGIQNIQPVAANAAEFLSRCGPRQQTARLYDLVFHDAVHGPAALAEYVDCVGVSAQAVAIHDFEQLPAKVQAEFARLFSRSSADADDKGRVLFVGWR